MPFLSSTLKQHLEVILGDHSSDKNVETQAWANSWNFMGMVSPLSSDEEGHLARSGHKLGNFKQVSDLEST